jgi:hypothetical protein
MIRLSARSAVIFVAGVAFGISLCLGKFAAAQGDENAFKFWGTAATLTAPDAPEALRRGYLAGVYDAASMDTITAEFAKNAKQVLTARLDCFATNAGGEMATFSNWAYAKWSSTGNQTFSGVAVLAAECHAEGYY